MVIVILIALAAVIYHNTDSGKEVEKRVGRAIEYKSLKERAGVLISKSIDFISLKGMRQKDKGKIVEKGIDKIKSLPGKIEPARRVEKISDKERKKLEDIIENEG
jgi:isopentenyl diphosphate isomerase/L-lactate dehydrogenase-like FMN-dependent dehydrogenase